MTLPLDSTYAGLGMVSRAAIIHFSASTLAVLQFLRHSLPSPHIVLIPLEVVVLAYVMAILLPAVVLAGIDVACQKWDATGRLVSRYRLAVIAVALVLILRQLQLYHASFRVLFNDGAGAVGSEALIFCVVAAIVVYAVVRWHQIALKFFQYFVPVAVVLLVVSVLEMTPAFDLPGRYGGVSTEGNPENPPVFVFVLDEMSYTQLDNGTGVDDDFPNFAALADDSAWFTNATTNHIHTQFIIPRFFEDLAPLAEDYRLSLYGQYLRVEATAWDECGRLYTCRGAGHAAMSERLALAGTLIRRGLWELAPGAVESNLASLTGWLQGPFDAPAPHIDDLGTHTLSRWQFEELHADIDAQNSRGNVSFFHSMLPHSPFIFQADGSIVSEYNHFQDAENEEPGSGYALYHEQTRYLDSLIGRFVAKLKTEGLYDDAVIIITGDHGIRTHEVEGNVLEDEPLPVTDIVTRIPLLIKAPDVRSGRYDTDYQHADFAATLMDVLGYPPPDEGVSAFAENRPDREKIFYVDDGNEVYWRYEYDRETGQWDPVEYVVGPLDPSVSPRPE